MNLTDNFFNSKTNKQIDFGFFKYFIFLYFFHAGVGIENQALNLAGNFGYGDIVIFLTLIFLVLYKRNQIKIDSNVLIPCVFGIISMFSILNLIIHGLDMHPALFGYVSRWFFYGIVVLVLTNYFFSIQDLLMSLLFLILGFATQLLIVWLNWFQNGVSFMNIPTLAYIEEYNSNTIGFYMSLAYAISLSFFLKEKKASNKIVTFVFVILSIFFLFSGFLTLSKGAWGCLAITSFIIFIMHMSVNFKSLIILLIFGILISIVSIYTKENFDLLEVVLTRLDTSTGSTNQRIDMFFSTFEILRDYTWLGAGPKSYELFGFYYVDGGHMSKDPHTALGGIFAELGIFAGFFYIFILFLYIPLKILDVMKKNYESYLYFLIINIWLVLVLFSFLSGLPSSDKILWILLSIIYFLKTHNQGEHNAIR